jgi:hypothetical protein
MESPPNPPQRSHHSVLTTLPALLTAIAAIVTAAAGLIAVFLSNGNSGSERAAKPEATPIVATSATPPSATSSPSLTPTATATATLGTPRAAGPPGVWPAKRSAYTVVLASREARAEAEAVAAEARGNLPAVGVLRSADYTSLRPGYWVAFSGVFGGKARATRNATDARAAGYSTAYVRWVQSE